MNSAREVALHDGTAASAGDLVITRHNDRRLRNGRTWVRNGSQAGSSPPSARTGSVSIRPAARRFGGGIVLPADHAEHLDLG